METVVTVQVLDKTEVGVDGNRVLEASVLLLLEEKASTSLSRSPATITTFKSNSMVKTVNMIDQIDTHTVMFPQKEVGMCE
jgi:hypothetical protein